DEGGDRHHRDPGVGDVSVMTSTPAVAAQADPAHLRSLPHQLAPDSRATILRIKQDLADPARRQCSHGRRAAADTCQDGMVPELPEVEALTAFLRETMVGRVVARVDVAAVSVLKTYDPEPTALGGLGITDVVRHGKFIDVDADGLHLVVH